MASDPSLGDLTDRLCNDLRSRWSRGDRILIEAVLQEHPHLAGSEAAVLDLLYAEFLAREQAGETPTPDEYYRRFPQLRDELTRLFDVHRHTPVSDVALTKSTTQWQVLTVDVIARQMVELELLTEANVATSLSALSTEDRNITGHLLRHLLETGKLTPFQAEQIQAGRLTQLRLGRYVLRRKLGAGGMGQVYIAHDTRMDRAVALKQLPPSVADDPATIKRFQREVKAAAKLNHPNIVTAYDADQSNGVHFLVMEWVDGADLATLVRQQGPFAVDHTILCLMQAARGLAYAHEQGVIHRDIKPANLLLDKKGVVKVLDLGLARIDGTASGDGLTGDEQVMGTVDFMSPEQAVDTHRADARSDVYSLGCTMWYLLTGRRMFDGDTAIQRMLKHREAPIPSLCASRNDVPPALDRLFQQMVAKQTQERTASMQEVHDRLSIILNTADQEPVDPSDRSVQALSDSNLVHFLKQTSVDEISSLQIDEKHGTPRPQSRHETQRNAPLIQRTVPGTKAPSSDFPVGRSAKSSRRTPLRIVLGGTTFLILIVAGIVVWMARDRQSTPPVSTLTGAGVPATEHPLQPAATNGITQTEASINDRKPASAPALSHYERLVSPLYEWTTPEKQGLPLNDPETFIATGESKLCFTSDGLTMLFTERTGGKTSRPRLRMATRSHSDAPWISTLYLTLPIALNNPTSPTINSDGSVLVFRDGITNLTHGKTDLYQLMRRSKDAVYDGLVHFGPEINSPGDDNAPALTADGLTLVFTKWPGPGSAELWVTTRSTINESFSPAVKIDQSAGFLSSFLFDGSGLLLAAPSKGQYLWVMRYNGSDRFDMPLPLNVPKPPDRQVQNSPCLLPDGETLYFEAHSTVEDRAEYWQTRRVLKK